MQLVCYQRRKQIYNILYYYIIRDQLDHHELYIWRACQFGDTELSVMQWLPSPSKYHCTAVTAAGATMLLLPRNRSCSGDPEAFHGVGRSSSGGSKQGCNAANCSRIPTQEQSKILTRVTAVWGKIPALSTHLYGEISSLATPTQLQLHRNSRSVDVFPSLFLFTYNIYRVKCTRNPLEIQMEQYSADSDGRTSGQT